MRAEKKYLITEVETHLKKSDYVILTNFSKVTSTTSAPARWPEGWRPSRSCGPLA